MQVSGNAGPEGSRERMPPLVLSALPFGQLRERRDHPLPRRPRKPCAFFGCPELVEAEERFCPRHRTQEAREDRRKRGNFRERGYDSRWDKVKSLKLRANPVCERCASEGRVTIATVVHHVIPVNERPDLLLSFENLKSLCRRCHAREHAKTAGQGRGKS